MPLRQTLERVEQEIQNGNLGQARERVYGLINSYPDNLSLRRKLAEIYWKLQYPAMAGRYWYLEEDQTAEMKSACQIFEKQMGEDPLQILLALKFRGNLEAVENQYAGRILLGLHKRAKEKYTNRMYQDFRNQGAKKFYAPQPAKSKKDSVGCALIAALGAALVLIGLYTIVEWIIKIIR